LHRATTVNSNTPLESAARARWQDIQARAVKVLAHAAATETSRPLC
jgi:hypothetical protein